MSEKELSASPYGKYRFLRLLRAVPFVLVLAAMIYGCNVQKPHSGYTVMFEKMPKLTVESIYYKGQDVGKALSAETGQGGIAKLTVALNSDFVQQNGYTFILCARNGRLEVEKLRSTGEPMDSKDIVYGFTSGSAVAWFKIKTLVRNRLHEARKQAERLYRRFQPLAR